MKEITHRTLRILVVVGFIIATLFPYHHPSLASTSSISARATKLSEWAPHIESGSFVYYATDNEIVCRPATSDDRMITERDPDFPLREISRRNGGFKPQAAGMLTISLRGTPQLDGFPQARDAFLRAAAIWSAMIQSEITIVIDVDFGPTRFGTPFPAGVLGSANSQQLGSNDGYLDVRAALISGAGTAEELALYNSLPPVGLPTDLGNTSVGFATSPLLRALGLLNPIADPDAEQAQLGSPPSIGFNSGFNFDFNPDNGITPGQIDFLAVAIHEIGHVLGFTSLVGGRELNPNLPIAGSVWDLFRFRPGATLDTFTSAQRILSSGGDQIFFAGGAQLPLSTGRPDGSGGDGNQASHWKDNTLAGVNVGIMDPAISPGERGEISANDLLALDRFGYGANVADPGAATVSKVTYNGKALVIKGKELTGNLEIEVNFEVVAPPRRIKPKPNGKQVKIPGSREQLNLQPGANQIRVIKDGLRSNVFVLNL